MLKKLLLILTLLCLGSSAITAQDVGSGDTSTEVETDRPLETEDDVSTAFGVLDLSDAELRVIAENIFNLTKSISEEFYISDGLSLATYILRYMAEIGEYELVYKDMMALVKAFEKLQDRPYDENIYLILEQIRKLQFGTRKGKLFVKFFSKAHEGIVYNIDTINEEEDSSLKEIKFVTIKNGAEMYFDEVDTKEERVELVKWVKKEYRIKTFGKYMFHPDIPKYIESYFDLETPANAMKIEYKDVVVKVGTDTIFKDMDLKFKDGYVLPGYRKGEKPIPSFLLRLGAKLVKVKTSIDQ
ncbi:MAG: hypothetical protein ACJAT2_001596 [Bacteriovoracaceae bacterium]|jgi:hypothetical protein